MSNLFGPESPQLVKFGLKPRKPRTPLTSQQLAVRAAKAEATRALRGTKGPVQKASTKAGPMSFVDPVPQVAQLHAPPADSPPASRPVSAGSIALTDSEASAASPPGNGTAAK